MILEVIFKNILTFKLRQTIIFLHLKSFFYIQTEVEYRILTFKTLFFTFDLRLNIGL